MAGIKQAQNVCHTCSLRKKACDKALPACSFCAKRGLLCRYDTAQGGHRAYNPGRHFVALQTEHVDVDPSDTPRIDRSLIPLPISVLCNGGQSLEESINQQVQHVTRLANLLRGEISERYFQTFRTYILI